MNLIEAIKSPKHYSKALLNKLNDFYRTIFYKGDSVHCEICNWRGQKFFEGKCPKCHSLPRTRLVPFSLEYFNLIEPKLKILHIAPNIHEFNYVEKRIPDVSVYDRLNNRNVSFINIVQDITKTTLEDNIYDLVICWHVLEHIPNDLKAIAEVYRILKPGGKFLVSVPIYPAGNETTYEDASVAYKDFEKVHGHFDHCRSCGLDYYKRFETCGFSTKTLKVETLDTETINRYGLRSDHVVWCFTK